MANARLYGFWADLTEALRTGAPQNECREVGFRDVEIVPLAGAASAGIADK